MVELRVRGRETRAGWGEYEGFEESRRTGENRSGLVWIQK